MMTPIQNAATWLFAREQDARYTLHVARLAILHPHDEMHPARSQIHAQRRVGEWAADSVASFAGSWRFVLLHVAWFSLWLLLHLDINLLTLIVSLEAIFLATFVLMSQNRGAAKDRTRDDTEAFEVDQLAEINRRQLGILMELRELARAIDTVAPGQRDGQAASEPSSQQASQVPHYAEGIVAAGGLPLVGESTPPESEEVRLPKVPQPLPTTPDHSQPLQVPSRALSGPTDGLRAKNRVGSKVRKR